MLVSETLQTKPTLKIRAYNILYAKNAECTHLIDQKSKYQTLQNKIFFTPLF